MSLSQAESVLNLWPRDGNGSLLVADRRRINFHLEIWPSIGIVPSGVPTQISIQMRSDAFRMWVVPEGQWFNDHQKQILQLIVVISMQPTTKRVENAQGPLRGQEMWFHHVWCSLSSRFLKFSWDSQWPEISRMLEARDARPLVPRTKSVEQLDSAQKRKKTSRLKGSKQVWPHHVEPENPETEVPDKWRRRLGHVDLHH